MTDPRNDRPNPPDDAVEEVLSSEGARRRAAAFAAGRELDALFPKVFLERYGATRAEAMAQLEERTGRLEAVLREADEAALQRPPAADRWSAAEVADHVARGARWFERALRRAAAGGPPLRPERGRVNAEGRPLAPHDGWPEPGRARDALLRDLARSRAALGEAAAAAEAAGALDRVCLEHGHLGPLTALEVLRLAAWHAGHHARQAAVATRGDGPG